MADPAHAEVLRPEAPDQSASAESTHGDQPDETGPEPQPTERSDGDAGGPSTLTAVQEQLEQLQILFKTKILDDEQQREWFARLTSELEEYRQDFFYKHVTSKIFRDLIQLYDTVDQTLRASEEGTPSPDALLSRLESLRGQLLRTMSRLEVALIDSAVGAPFDETEQEAIDVRPVDRPEDDGTVVEVARLGFRYGQRLLRPESVIVGRYQFENRGDDA